MGAVSLLHFGMFCDILLAGGGLSDESVFAQPQGFEGTDLEKTGFLKSVFFGVKSS